MTLRAALAAAALAAALLIIPPAAGGASAQEPQRGGTLNLIVQPEPPILMLGLNQQGPTQYVANKIYEGLLVYSRELEPMPSLARSWEVSDDGRTYTFHLQENVRWHDGEPFTAEDVVFTTDVFLRETHPRARLLFGRTESIRAVDEHTVEFTLTEPFPPFMFAFEVSTAPMVPKHLYEGTDFRTNPNNERPIGTGPFRFQEWQRGSFVHLVRNDDYWQEGKPYLDQIYYRVVPDAASRAVAFETGEVDVLRGGDVEYFDIQRLAELPNVEVDSGGYEMFSPLSWMQFNLREAPLDDRRFRQAVMYAIDREFIRDNIWFGFGRIPTGPISSTTLFYDPNVPTYGYDPERATQLLDEMGLEPDGSGVRATISMMPLPYGETWQRLAEYVRQQLEQVGIRVNMEATDAGGWAQRVGEWDFETTFNFLYQYGDPALGVARSYISTNIIRGTPFANNGGYNNPQVDELFEKAATAPTPQERQQYYTEVQKLLAEELPVVWILELEFPTIYRSNIHNLITTGIGPNETFADVYFSGQ